MWKVITSSNLNPQLKLYFYSPILANNNILLKIYCENIVITKLYFSFVSFNRPYVSFFFFFFFFSLDFPPPHMYTLISTLSFFFSTFLFPLHSRTSLPLSFSNFLSLLFFFFFYLIPNGERERTNGLDGSALCAAAPSAPPLSLIFLPTQPRW